METVILLTGYGAHPTLMWPIRRYLNQEGFAAESWPYDSLRGSIATHGARLAEALREKDAGATKLHLVGHSMGSILVREALRRYRPERLGRVVLCAPPNRGARLADLSLKLGQRSTAAVELSSRPDSYVNRMPPPEGIDFGVLAARFDHVVDLASTHLDGERDHLVLTAPHTLILHPRAGRQIAHFLRHGRFDRD